MENLKSREAAAKAFATETGYSVDFHEGLASESANKIRSSAEAVIKAALKQSVEDREFTDLILAVAYSADPVASASSVIGAMASVVEMKRGKAAVGQLMQSIASIYTPA